MGLIMANPPANGIEVVTNALQLLAQARPATEAHLAGSGAPKAHQLVDPQQVYQIDLDRIGGPDPLQFARPVAWRYLILKNAQPIEAAETTLGDAEPIRFTQVNRGPKIEGFVQAIRTAEATAEEQPNREWEIRYLRIPALYIDAIWLHDAQQQPQGDLFIPIQPVFAPLQANHAYSETEFFQQLQDSVTRRLQSSDATNG
jgi:hypothetical protein